MPSRSSAGDGPRDLSAAEVNAYLDEEEHCLSQSILQSCRVTGDSPQAPLIEAVDRALQQLRGWKGRGKGALSSQDFEALVANINGAFRRYQEVLEGCATQLFAEMEQLRIDRLDEEILNNVAQVKQKMVRQVNSAVLQFKRLESELTSLGASFRTRWPLVSSFSRFFRSTLDRQLVHKLQKVHEIVDAGYVQLHERHQKFHELDVEISKKLKKFKHYAIFHTQPARAQQEYREIYRLIKMRRKAEKAAPSMVDAVDRLLKEAIKTDHAVEVFKDYFRALEDVLYSARRGLSLKSEAELAEAETKRSVLEEVLHCRMEVHTLGVVICRYRDFLLSTHPDPYVRARLGFSERTVGPEPEATRLLMSLAHQVEAFDSRLERFAEVVEHHEPQPPSQEEMGYFDELLDRFEELARRTRSAEAAMDALRPLLVELEEVEELYHLDRYRIMGMEKALRLALRLDRFDVLVDDKKFRSIYNVHIRVRGPIVHDEQRARLEVLAGINEELGALRTDTASRSHSARVIAKSKSDEWVEAAEPFLTDLEEYLEERKKSVPVPLDELMGAVRQRRQEVLEFLFAYRSLVKVAQGVGADPSPALEEVFDRINRIENDFNYLNSHHARERTPLSYQQLKGLESL